MPYSFQSVLEENFKKAAEAISGASSIIFSSGAGMGVDSGLPDFRGENGFWKAYPKLSNLNISFSEIAQASWFVEDPRLAWAFYGHRLNMYRNHNPHLGYDFLSDLSKKYNHFAVTSNVDGFHKKSGISDSNIWEVHGSIHHLQPCNQAEFMMDGKWHNSLIVSADSYNVEIDEETFKAIGDLPMIGNDLLRPNILMFLDYAWSQSREYKQRETFERWTKTSDMSKLVIIECGAGIEIPTIRSFGHRLKTKFDGTLIRINPNDFRVLNKENNKGIEIATGAENALLGIKKYL